MAKIIDFPTLTKQEIMLLSEIVYKQIMYDSQLSNLITIENGVATGDRLAWVDPLTKIGKKSSGCSPRVDQPTASITEKRWDLKEFDFRIVQCYKDLLNTLYNMGLKDGALKGDLSDTDWLDFLLKLLTDAIEQMYFRFAFFGDSDADTHDNGGILTPGTDIDFYNVVDGFFKQIEAMQADPAGIGRGMVLTRIDSNESPGRSGQFDGWIGFDNQTGESALSILDKLILYAPRMLKRQPDQIIMASKFLLDKAKEEIMTLPQYTESQFGITENGIAVLNRQGMRILEVPQWDDIISTDMILGDDDDSPYYKPFRAIYTTKSNLVTGVPNTSTMGDLNMWYEKKERQYYIEGLDDIDNIVMRPDLISIAW